MAETPYNTILNDNSQNKKSKAKNMKYIVRIREPIHFSWRLKLKWWTNWGFCEKLDGLEKGITGEDNEQSQNFEGKLKKVLKTNLFAQNMRFSWLG